MNGLHRVELGILHDVARLCDENGIAYFLDYGTLIGAMRHDGFIPWDDDIDIGMMREDYERFISIAPSALADKYEVISPENCAQTSATFTKIWRKGTKFYTSETLDAGLRQGIGIDVFPYDVMDEDEARAQNQERRCMLLQRILYLYHSAHVVVPHGGALGAVERGCCHVAHALLKLTRSHESIYKAFLDTATACNPDVESPDDTCASMTYVYHVPRKVIFPLTRHVFEGEEFSVPADPDRYLTIVYGDWRKIPPVEEQHQHPGIEVDFGSALDDAPVL